MTLRLILMRHAKSDWDNPLDTDHQRPLSARGFRAAPAIGGWLLANSYLPGQALVSDATRTRQTWALVSQVLGTDVPVSFLPALYLASPDTLLRVLRGASAQVVMLLAHNPGMGELAAQLIPERPAHPAFGRYPTGATLVLDFDAPDWASIRRRASRVVDFIVPRDLE
jgi:phosphohistidine phosphatase